MTNNDSALVREAQRAPLIERRFGQLIADLGPMQEATEVPDLFAALARAVVNALNADACLVSILDTDRSVVRDVAASVRPPARFKAIAEELRLADFPATRRLVENGHSLQVSVGDPFADDAERNYLRKIGFGRVLICRFSVADEAFGIVEAYRSDDRSFRSDDDRQVDLLATFAASCYSRLQLAAKLESHYTKMIEALMSALKARDPYTQAHTGRIRDMALALAVALQVPAEVRKAVRLGAILHDVGKIGIPDTILRKPGALTPDEWKVMRIHPEIGERMLTDIDFIAPALPIIRHHHERWDGRGYPDALAGEDIPLGARIVAVCDAFDAMTTDRPYRKALPVEFACEELLSCAGSQFDPACAALLVHTISKMGAEGLEDRFIRYAS